MNNDDRDRQDDGDDRVDLQAARDKVRPPAITMQVIAAIGIVISLGLMLFALLIPTVGAGWIEDLIEKENKKKTNNVQFNAPDDFKFNAPAPPGKMSQKQLDEQKQALKFVSWFYGIMFGAGGFLGLLMNTLMFLGAGKMRKLESFGFAMTANIIGIVSGIMCSNIPGLAIGIWGIIMLNDNNVKAAFAAKARRR